MGDEIRTLDGMAHLGYARVSTDLQDPALQLDALAAAGCDRVWTDRASGATVARPQLDALLDYARPGDVVVVWRLDRLGRSVPHLIDLVNTFKARGIEFRSLTESLDTTTPGGVFVFHTLAAVAQLERDLIRARTVAGLAAAAARGRRGGRPTVMTAERAEQADRLLSEDASIASVARAVGVSRPTIYRHIERRRAEASGQGLEDVVPGVEVSRA